MRKQSSLRAWVIDDTGFPKKGKHSVGVARQYCGQLGKQDNCRVAVSPSIPTAKASWPVAYDLYLPESWALDGEKSKKTGLPEEIEFRTRPLIAIEQIHETLRAGHGRLSWRMPPMATMDSFAKRWIHWSWNTWLEFNPRFPSGAPAEQRCPPK